MIRPPNTSDTQEILNLAEILFGKGYFDTYIQEMAVNRSLSFISFTQKKCSGFLFGRHHSEKVIELKSICVHPDFQGQSIGRSLVHFFEKNAKENGYLKALAPCLKIENGYGSGLWLEHLGYVYLSEDKNIWKPDCDKGKFDCPHRTHKCVCSAQFYEKNL